MPGSRCSRLHQRAGEGPRLAAPPTCGRSTVGGRRGRSSTLPRSTKLPWIPRWCRLSVGTGLPTVVAHGRTAPALRQARQRKERVYPELSGAHGRARLVVLASEVGGRWSAEAQAFLRQLARAKSRQEPPTLRASAKLAWIWRWSMILACASARAFALSLLEGRTAHGCDSPTPPTAEVIGTLVTQVSRDGRCFAPLTTFPC